MRSNAPSASAQSRSNTPASIHSSRRDLSVVSDTRHSKTASTLVHEAPVTSRTSSPKSTAGPTPSPGGSPKDATQPARATTP